MLPLFIRARQYPDMPDKKQPNRSPFLPKAGLLREDLAAQAQAASTRLRAESPSAGEDELLLYDLVAAEMPVIAALNEVQHELSQRLLEHPDNPKILALLVRVLRDVVAVSTALGRRVEGGLSAASALRAQREFLHRKRSR